MINRYVNTNSTPGGDGTTNNIVGNDRAFASLSEAELALRGEYNEHLVIYCDGSKEDVIPVIFDTNNYTFSPHTLYIVITSPNFVPQLETPPYWKIVGTPTGIWDNSKYRMHVSGESCITYHGKEVGNRLWIKNIQFTADTGSVTNGVLKAEGYESCYIQSSIIKVPADGCGISTNMNMDVGGPKYNESDYRDNVIYSLAGGAKGFNLLNVLYTFIYNNLITNFDIGINKVNVLLGHWIKNNIVFNNIDDFAGSYDILDRNASDDGDGTNPIVGTIWSDIFTNTDYLIDGDFRIVPNSNLHQRGLGPEVDGNVVPLDIRGDVRSGITSNPGPFEVEDPPTTTTIAPTTTTTTPGPITTTPSPITTTIEPFVFDEPYEPIETAQCVEPEISGVQFWDYLSTFWNNLDDKSRQAFESFWDGMVRVGTYLKKSAARFVEAQAPTNSRTCVLDDYYEIKFGPLYSLPINLDPTNKNPQYLITPIARVLVDPTYDENNERIYHDRLALNAMDYYSIRSIGLECYAVVALKDNSIAPKWFKIKNLLSSEEVSSIRFINPTSDTINNYIVELENADLAYLANKPFTFYITTARAYKVESYVLGLPQLQIHIGTQEQMDFQNNKDYVLYNNIVEFNRDLIDTAEVMDGSSLYCRWAYIIEYMLFEMYGSIVGIPDWQKYNYGNISGKAGINALLKSVQNLSNREDMERAIHVYYGLPIAPEDCEVIGLYESYGYEVIASDRRVIQLYIPPGSQLTSLIQVGSRLHVDGKKDVTITDINPDRSKAQMLVDDTTIAVGDEVYIRLRNRYDLYSVVAEGSTAAKIVMVCPEGADHFTQMINTVQAISEGKRYPEIVISESSNGCNGLYHMTKAEANSQLVTLTLYKATSNEDPLYNDCIKVSSTTVSSGKVHIPWPTHKFLLLQLKDKYFKAYLDAPIDTTYDAMDKLVQYQTIANNVSIVNNHMFEGWDEFDNFKIDSKIQRDVTMLQLVHAIPDAVFGEYFPSEFVITG